LFHTFLAMECKDTLTAAADEDLIAPPTVDADSSFRISTRPVVSRTDAESPDVEALHLPRSYGTETLSLLARDPHTVFAFWDIDWNAAFRGLALKERKVHLRLLDADGTEQTTVEVEPMAGSCYVTVADADAAYSGEIGYYHPTTKWHCLATSGVVTTPPDAYAAQEEVDFATVPFHLSFQRIVDLLQVTRQENAALTAMLADLCERVTSAEHANLTSEQRELARVVEKARSTADTSAAARSSNPRLQRQLERILGFGSSSSPAGGFGGSSRGA
jgi:hypothetical protein